MHVHVRRLDSVVKMATVLEECITEKQHSVALGGVGGKRTQCKEYS
jgi:hypothetical protein